jgi:hypothetical protein
MGQSPADVFSEVGRAGRDRMRREMPMALIPTIPILASPKAFGGDVCRSDFPVQDQAAPGADQANSALRILSDALMRWSVFPANWPRDVAASLLGWVCRLGKSLTLVQGLVKQSIFGIFSLHDMVLEVLVTRKNLGAWESYFECLLRAIAANLPTLI